MCKISKISSWRHLTVKFWRWGVGSVILSLLPAWPMSAQVYINEIHFHPAGTPEPVEQEFIEITHRGTSPVDLSFWSCGGYVFPAGFSLAAGEHVVIAAQPSLLQAAVPNARIVGPLTDTLSNASEKITLRDAAGRVVSEVRYGDEADWAVRRRNATDGSWDWFLPADGRGPSLELVQPELDRGSGQNWQSSVNAGGTPGQANSRRSQNIAPLISQVRHQPIIPRSNDSVEITARLIDEEPSRLTAVLHWREATTSPTAFRSLPMTAIGDGYYRATIPPQPALSLIEYYVQANDSTQSRTWPAPTTGANAADQGQLANALYQVDEEIPPPDVPTYRIILTASDNAIYNTQPSSSNRQFHAALVRTYGRKTQVWQQCSFRVRGAGSRSYIHRPIRFSLPSDAPFNGATIFNFNPKYPWLQYFGMQLFSAAGLRAPEATPIELRRNGIEYVTGSANAQDFGRWVKVEHLDADFVDRVWPDEPTGNLYKKARPDNSWRVPPSYPTTVPNEGTDGWTKETNGAANDWTDLHQLLTLINNQAADGIITDNEVAALTAQIDFPQWMRWFALMTILANAETSASNGTDDDYSLYRSTAGGRFYLIPHDLDTILGRGDTTRPPNRTLFDMSEVDDVLEPLVPYLGTSTGGGHPAVRAAYYAQLRELCRTLFSASNFNTLLDNELRGWVPESILGTTPDTGIKRWVLDRCAFIEASLAADTSVTLPPFPDQTPTTLDREPVFADSLNSPLVINEVLPYSVNAPGSNGNSSPLIELKNTTSQPLDIGGWKIGPYSNQADSYTFPPGTIVPADGYLTLIADGRFTLPLHTAFILPEENGHLFLFRPQLTSPPTFTIVDQLVYSRPLANFSLSRIESPTPHWTLGSFTYQSANQAVALGSIAQLLLNEWCPNAGDRVSQEFIELRSLSDRPIAISQCRLTTDLANPQGRTFGPLCFIAPGEYLLILDSSRFLTGELSLDAEGDDLFFLGANQKTHQRVHWNTARPDQTFGYDVSPSPLYAALPQPSPGAPNQPLPAAQQDLLDFLRISEIHYAPPAGDNYEFIELQNTSSRSLDLSEVFFSSGIDFTFPAGTQLAPGAVTVVAKNSSVFTQRYGAGRPVSGEYTGSLSNLGESLSLSLPSPSLLRIQRVRYASEWYPTAAAEDRPLTVVSLALPYDGYSSAKAWQPAASAGGTPGLVLPPVITSPLTAQGLLGDPFSYQITANHVPLRFTCSPLPAGLILDEQTGVISGTPTVYGIFPLTITAINYSGQDQRTLILSIAASGPFSHFLFPPSGLIGEVNQPVPFTVRAVDARGRTVVTDQSTWTPTAVFYDGKISPVVITECDDRLNDLFEIQNLSPARQNTSGWIVGWNDAGVNFPRDINLLHSPTLPLPASLPPGALWTVDDNNLYGQIAPGGIAWNHTNAANRRGWVALASPTHLADFIVWGYTETEVASWRWSQAGFSTPLTQLVWNGPSVAHHAQNAALSLQRRTHTALPSAAQWAWATPSPNLTNPALPQPTLSAINASVQPSSITLTSGFWSGQLSITPPANAPRPLTFALRWQSGSLTDTTFPYSLKDFQNDPDRDGLTTSWETTYGLNPQLAADATSDTDGDGWPAWAEFLSQTDPTQAGSFLQLPPFTRISSSLAEISFTLQPNTPFHLQASTDLTTWQTLGTDWSDTTGQGRLRIPLSPTPFSFYRVQLIRP